MTANGVWLNGCEEWRNREEEKAFENIEISLAERKREVTMKILMKLIRRNLNRRRKLKMWRRSASKLAAGLLLQLAGRKCNLK
jgi:hypothetical protein